MMPFKSDHSHDGHDDAMTILQYSAPANVMNVCLGISPFVTAAHSLQVKSMLNSRTSASSV
jgi:hypothetical protein